MHNFHKTETTVYASGSKIVRGKTTATINLTKFQTEGLWERLCGIKDCKCSVDNLIVDGALEISSKRPGTLSITLPLNKVGK